VPALPTAQTPAPNSDRARLGLAHPGTEHGRRLERRVRVRRVAEVPQLALAVSDRRQERAALADPLHRRHPEIADERRCGLDPRHCLPSTAATTTP